MSVDGTDEEIEEGEQRHVMLGDDLPEFVPEPCTPRPWV
jgi:hypothetical protein